MPQKIFFDESGFSGNHGRGERQLAEDKRGMVDPERAGAVPPAIRAEDHAAVFGYP